MIELQLPRQVEVQLRHRRKVIVAVTQAPQVQMLETAVAAVQAQLAEMCLAHRQQPEMAAQVYQAQSQVRLSLAVAVVEAETAKQPLEPAAPAVVETAGLIAPQVLMVPLTLVAAVVVRGVQIKMAVQAALAL
jgi:hypothetical protein